MKVRLTTTISTIIEIDPENTTEFATAEAEIFGRFNDQSDSEDTCESIKAAHSNAVKFDDIVGTEVTHSFEEL